MFNIVALLYGFASYGVFLATFLYAIGFVTGLVVPKTIDIGSPATRQRSNTARRSRPWTCSSAM